MKTWQGMRSASSISALRIAKAARASTGSRRKPAIRHSTMGLLTPPDLPGAEAEGKVALRVCRLSENICTRCSVRRTCPCGQCGESASCVFDVALVSVAPLGFKISTLRSALSYDRVGCGPHQLELRMGSEELLRGSPGPAIFVVVMQDHEAARIEHVSGALQAQLHRIVPVAVDMRQSDLIAGRKPHRILKKTDV